MIMIEQLSVAYKKTKQEVLRNISFSVKKGERVAILGPSGCGKTTLLYAVAGLLNKSEATQEGAIILGEKARIGMVFQKPTLLPWETVSKNITYGCDVASRKVSEEEERQLIQIIGLKGFEQYYPAQLSLGMQQRVNFARALAIKPDLLLMDEPFSGLDVATKETIQKEFKEVLERTHMTTLFVTHSLDEAMFLADRIVILSSGPGEVKTILVNKPGESANLENYYIDNDEE